MKAAVGYCWDCGAIVDGARYYCDECRIKRHREANARHYKKCKQNGWCVYCGKSTNGLVYCEDCRKKMGARA